MKYTATHEKGINNRQTKDIKKNRITEKRRERRLGKRKKRRKCS